MYNLGVDVGFGFTKATDGKQVLSFKSLIGDAVEIQFWSDVVEAEPVDNLHVTIDSKEYFIGDLAERQSNVRHFTLDQTTLLENSLRILALTAAGTFRGEDIQFNVVTGLPVSYFRQQKDRLATLLRGMHRVKYHTPDAKQIESSFLINRIQVIPQPFGSIFNLIMNNQGKIVNTDLAKKKLGIIDVGFRTTDITISDGLRYVERGSRTTDTGISKAFSIIAKKLSERTGVEVELFRLYNWVSGGSIKIRGKEYILAELRDQVYSQLAATIASDVERLWMDEWDIDVIILTGGGGGELASFLEPLLVSNMLVADKDGDPRLSNVQGFLKFAMWSSQEQQ